MAGTGCSPLTMPVDFWLTWKLLPIFLQQAWRQMSHGTTEIIDPVPWMAFSLYEGFCCCCWCWWLFFFFLFKQVVTGKEWIRMKGFHQSAACQNIPLPAPSPAFSLSSQTVSRDGYMDPKGKGALRALRCAF